MSKRKVVRRLKTWKAKREVKATSLAISQAVLDEVEYIRRLRLMRQIICGDNATEFAERLGIPYKRWSNYERGYAVSRATSLLLWTKFQISLDWLFFGAPGNMPQWFLDKVKEADAKNREHQAAEKELRQAQAKFQKADANRKAFQATLQTERDDRS